MSGAQLVVFPFLVLMLPIVAALAWWLKRRYSAEIIRLQKEATVPSTAEADGVTIADSGLSVTLRTPVNLRLRIMPAQEVPYRSDRIDETSAHHRLRRRVLSVQFGSGLLYWCVVWLFVAAVFADAYGSNITQLTLVGALVGPAPLVAL